MDRFVARGASAFDTSTFQRGPFSDDHLYLRHRRRGEMVGIEGGRRGTGTRNNLMTLITRLIYAPV